MGTNGRRRPTATLQYRQTWMPSWDPKPQVDGAGLDDGEQPSTSSWAPFLERAQRMHQEALWMREFAAQASTKAQQTHQRTVQTCRTLAKQMAVVLSRAKTVSAEVMPPKGADAHGGGRLEDMAMAWLSAAASPQLRHLGQACCPLHGLPLEPIGWRYYGGGAEPRPLLACPLSTCPVCNWVRGPEVKAGVSSLSRTGSPAASQLHVPRGYGMRCSEPEKGVPEAVKRCATE